MLVLDINDTEVTLTRDGEVLYAEPGVAFAGQDGTAFGNEALAQSRLHPRQSHNEFWQRLNADPVTPPAPGVANQADLVYLHLQAIRAAAGIAGREELVVAASAASKPEQLAMLLGIAVEAGFDVRAIVDAAVTATCLQDVTGPCRLLDIALHRAIVTDLTLADGAPPELNRGAVDEIPAAGFAALVEGWVDVVADRFVDATRFDPLRIAQSEQQLFDQVVAGIDNDDAEFAIAVHHDGVARQVNVPRRAFAEKSEQRFALLTKALGAPGTLAITHRVRKVPGLAASLQAAGHELLLLPRNAVATGIEAHSERMPAVRPGSGARLIASLPLRVAQAASATAVTPPTHLLCGNIAVALGAETDAKEHPACRGGSAMFHVKRDGRGAFLAPDEDAIVSLNGARIDFEHPLAAGDVVVSGNTKFTLIVVVNEPTR